MWPDEVSPAIADSGHTLASCENGNMNCSSLYRLFQSGLITGIIWILEYFTKSFTKYLQLFNTGL